VGGEQLVHTDPFAYPGAAGEGALH
jgi:hypothetical protein